VGTSCGRFVLALASLSSVNLRREEGQTLAEYALILALVAVAVVGIVITLGGNIASIFSNISSDI
jgi:pilus assembly protein Flp/PilA